MAPIASSTEVVPLVGAVDLRLVARLREEYEETRTEPFAGDLLSTAMAIGCGDLVRDVADDIVGSATASPAVVRLARRVLGMPLIDTTPKIAVHGGIVESGELTQRIVRIKRRLRSSPRNAFDWIDLGLLYESLGQRDHAERAVRAALSIAPGNRFVLRSAARFLIHRNEYDAAHKLLVRAPSIKHDPWLMAAEIATSNIIGKTSAHVKSARRWIESGHLEPFHASELASAVGTVELLAGSMKFAKRFFRASLERPTENAVAQASWADRQFGGAFLWQEQASEVPLSPEANAVSLLQTEKWTEALDYTMLWLADQPFSAKPVINASFLYSSMMGNPRSAIAVCRFGLMANPNDAGIRNNLAFAYCMADDPDAADRTLRHISLAGQDARQLALLAATRGLIAFRKNFVKAGRLGYQEAIDYFDRKGEKALALRARLYLAMEEIRLGNEDGRKAAYEALQSVANVSDGVTNAIADKIGERLSIPVPRREPDSKPM